MIKTAACRSEACSIKQAVAGRRCCEFFHHIKHRRIGLHIGKDKAKVDVPVVPMDE